MAKLILKYEDVFLKEYPLEQEIFKIGRREGNNIQIDNMAVSSFHAKVEKQDDGFVVTDLNSLNGIYVNKQKISQKKLRHNDQILIGKHVIVFYDEKEEGAAMPKVTEPTASGGTVVLDSRKIQELLASKGSEGEVEREAAAEEPAEPERIAVLTIISGGETDEPQEVDLLKKVTVLGKGEGCDVRVKGLFVSKTAAVISRRGSSYMISHAEGLAKTHVNGRPIASQRELREGDQIEIGSTKMVFTFKE